MCKVGSTLGWMADRETAAAMEKTTAQRQSSLALVDMMFATMRVDLSNNDSSSPQSCAQATNVCVQGGVLLTSQTASALHVAVDAKQQSKVPMLSGSKTEKANGNLDCIERGESSRVREVILFLYSAVLRTRLEDCIHHWGPQHKKDIDLSE
ncbi:hypothetical protein WISP_04739 [Willisornis vidua]|uniref:Uncharacterized protein n=1 Tax=Willisornis vidua TaxID=1566151 RepID=A0ABQ9DZ56_9PASS|nr:hypothetical protein WISP_04739 [Willisornis vidua]